VAIPSILVAVDGLAPGRGYRHRLIIGLPRIRVRHLGRIENGLACAHPAFEDVRDVMEDSASGFGRLTGVRPSAVMSETPPRWVRPSMPLGSHAPEWPR